MAFYYYLNIRLEKTEASVLTIIDTQKKNNLKSKKSHFYNNRFYGQRKQITGNGLQKYTSVVLLYTIRSCSTFIYFVHVLIICYYFPHLVHGNLLA